MLYGAVGKVGLRASAAPFSPSQLFAAGEQGVWYDPSDFSTMFQDAAGTTPVTAVEQPVGRILDKSGRGNHATQSTSASRPVLSARVNLLTKTEQFDDAVWTKGGLVTAGMSNVTVAPDGTTTADQLIETAATTFHYAEQSAGTAVSGTQYKYSVYCKANGREHTTVVFGGSVSTAWVAATFNLTGSGSVTKVGNGSSSTYVSSSITSVGNGWYLCSVTGQHNTTSSNVPNVQPCNSGTPTYSSYGVVSYTGDGTSGIYIWGADLRVSNVGVNLPVYQRVNTSTDYDTTGFPYYLRFDGTDDSMATGTINPGSVDKAQVFAGVRKLSDGSSISVTAELSSNIGTNPGAFLTFQSASDGTNRSSWASGTGGATGRFVRQGRTYAAPITNVITTLHDIAGSTYGTAANIRVNGAAPSSFFDEPGSAGPTGGGNFGSYPLFIGSRAGSGNRFNGHLYSLIVRFSATNLPDATIAQTETWVAGNTGLSITPTFPAPNYLIWGSGDYLIWGSGNNIAWGTS